MKFNKDDDLPVTVTISQRVKPGCEAAFEEVILAIAAAAKTFKGHLGVNIFRPSDLSFPEYWIIFKFDRISNLRRWEKSEVRRKWLNRAAKLTLGSPETQIITGLEMWFTLPTQKRTTAPPRYKMALITWLAIFPPIVLINALFGALLNQLPSIVRSLVLTIVLVLFMTYVLMPRMTRLFARWLYPRTFKSYRKAYRLGKKQH